MRYWLVKSEPAEFSWRRQVENGVEPWTGVRNHEARRHLAEMRRGDRAFFYHSNKGREIVGVVEVVREAYPDPTGPEGGWIAVTMKAVGPLPRPVRLATLKADPEFADFALIRRSRLSVLPVAESLWRRLCAMGGFPG